MNSLITTIIGVFGYIIIGYVIRKLNFLPIKIINIFDFTSFNILLPLALVVNFWLINFPEIIIYKLLITFFGAGIIVFIIGFLSSKKLFQFETDNSALFGLGSCRLLRL